MIQSKISTSQSGECAERVLPVRLNALACVGDDGNFAKGRAASDLMLDVISHQDDLRLETKLQFALRTRRPWPVPGLGDQASAERRQIVVNIDRGRSAVNEINDQGMIPQRLVSCGLLRLREQRGNCYQNAEGHRVFLADTGPRVLVLAVWGAGIVRPCAAFRPCPVQ